jgi:hypothetical protein
MIHLARVNDLDSVAGVEARLLRQLLFWNFALNRGENLEGEREKDGIRVPK